MRLLPRRKRSTFDPAMGDTEIHDSIDRLLDGDWRAVQELLESHDDAWVISSVLHDDLADIPLEHFATWADASGSALAAAHLGQAHVVAAWEIRGRGSASEIGAEAQHEFLNGLQRAETILREAAAMDPRLAEPWVGLMATARGFGMPKSEVESRFVEVHGREPFRPDACHHMLQHLCAKSGGNHAEMFEFADWARRESAKDSPCGGLVASAHLEYAMAERIPLPEYLRRPEVGEELLAAARPMLEETTTGAGTEHVTAFNLFLLTIEPKDALSGRAVRETITRIADRPSSIPWRYFGDDIGRRFARIRDERAMAAKRL